MEFYSRDEQLEYYFTLGVSKGYSFEESVAYAEEQFNEYNK